MRRLIAVIIAGFAVAAFAGNASACGRHGTVAEGPSSSQLVTADASSATATTIKTTIKTGKSN